MPEHTWGLSFGWYLDDYVNWNNTAFHAQVRFPSGKNGINISGGKRLLNPSVALLKWPTIQPRATL